MPAYKLGYTGGTGTFAACNFVNNEGCDTKMYADIVHTLQRN